MRHLSILIFTFLVISCSQEFNESNIKQIWIKDSKYNSSSIILAFNETTCYSVLIRPDYFDIHKEIYTLGWHINRDTLIFQDSAKTDSKYLIHALTKDSLVIEYVTEDTFHSIEGFTTDPNYSSNNTTFYSISSTKIKFTKKQLDNIILNNSFTFKSSFHDKSYYYDFITKTKCIDKIDSINFQLEYWETANINDEVFLFIKYPVNTGIFHLLQIIDDSLFFENIYEGVNKSFLIKRDYTNNIVTEDLLGKWSSFTENNDSIISILPPPPPISPNEKKNYTIGMMYHFFANNTYVFRKGYKFKQGFWRLSQSKKYILLDSLKGYKDLIRINLMDSNSFSLLLYSDIEAQTEIIELSKSNYY